MRSILLFNDFLQFRWVRATRLHVGRYKNGNLHGLLAATCERIIDLQPTIELINKAIERQLLPQSDPPLYTVLGRDVLEGGCDGV